MSTVRDESNKIPLPERGSTPLNQKQYKSFTHKLTMFADYLREEGKDRKKKIGYSESSVKPRLHRIRRIMNWVWNNREIKTSLDLDDGKAANKALYTDELRKYSGKRYAEATKRKLNDTLNTWFEFQGIDWEPEYTFTDGRPKQRPDPFTKYELKKLSEGALTYKTIPKYNNLTPEDRERWKIYIAQELGKPKSEVSPKDWEKINTCWKIPSLIRTAREAGWRPDIMDRLAVDWYVPEEKMFDIPAGKAPKNDAKWEVYLSDEAAYYLENWLEQRENMEMYDGRDLIWLTREGNSYSSGTLNDVLNNLIDHVGINDRGRKLVWYSFRHSIGTYVSHEKSKQVAAQKLRHTKGTIDRYIHTLPNEQRDASGIM